MGWAPLQPIERAARRGLTMTTTLTSAWWSASFRNADCDVVGSGSNGFNCVSSGTQYQSSLRPTGYLNNAACTITAQQNLYVRSVYFSTAPGDQLLFNDGVYEGTNGPQGYMDAGDVITWSSDASGVGTGWTLCAHPAPPPPPPPQQPPPHPPPSLPPPQAPPASFFATLGSLGLYLPVLSLLGLYLVSKARRCAQATGQSASQRVPATTKRATHASQPDSSPSLPMGTAVTPMGLPVVAAPVGGAGESMVEGLARLSDMRASGAISAAEFELAKARVIGGGAGGVAPGASALGFGQGLSTVTTATTTMTTTATFCGV